MTIIMAIIAGSIIGWLMALARNHSSYLISSIIAGVIGALIGVISQTLASGAQQIESGVSWIGLMWALVGAVVLTGILNSFSTRSTHQT